MSSFRPSPPDDSESWVVRVLVDSFYKCMTLWKNALVVFHCVLDQVGDHLSVQPSFGEKKQQHFPFSPVSL